MASNAKWRDRLVESLQNGDLDFWRSNNGYLNSQEIAALESLYLDKPLKSEKQAPKAASKPKVKKPLEKKAPKE